MADHAGNIMEKLREQYPDIREFNTTSLQVEINAVTAESNAQQETTKQWRMNNPESNFGFVFGEDRLVIHTTAYSHFESFAEKIQGIAQTVSNTASIEYSRSIGIRHIDNIKPIDNMDLSQLMKLGYLCPPQNAALTPIHSRVEFVYQSDIGRLYTRAFQLSNHPKVPQDLFPMADQLSSDIDLMAPVPETFILVDTDHIYSPNNFERFNIDNILTTLHKLNKQCSLGFREMVTPEAIAAWGQE